MARILLFLSFSLVKIVLFNNFFVITKSRDWDAANPEIWDHEIANIKGPLHQRRSTLNPGQI